MSSKWLEWKPNSDTFDTPHIGKNPIIHASEGRNETQGPRIIERTHIPSVSKVSEVNSRPAEKRPWIPYAMPEGVRLVSWEPKPVPVAIDICSVVMDVPKFVQSELSALDSRLNNPWAIHGGFTVPQILDRLAQAGVFVALAIEPVSSEQKNVSRERLSYRVTNRATTQGNRLGQVVGAQTSPAREGQSPHEALASRYQANHSAGHGDSRTRGRRTALRRSR
jgi:hypothetical protein